ncbi:MAG: ATP-binding cassette domain-containing protein [Pseudomonadota bacterium]
MVTSSLKPAQGLSILWQTLRKSWVEIGIASLLINSGQLLLPLFSMLVYDKVVSNGVFETLWALAIGMLIFISFDIGMRVVRAWTVERAAKVMAIDVDDGLWRRLLADRKGPGSIANFIAHYRDLTSSLGFISSTYLLAIADLPFYLLYMLVIGLIAWPLMILVGVLTLIYAALGFIIQNRTLRLTREAEKLNTVRMAYMGEVLQGIEIARTTKAIDLLESGWKQQSGKVNQIEAERRLATTHTNTLSASMSTFTTVCVLVTGAYLIEARELSVGALIACSLLASRAMMLVTSLYLVLGKWQDYSRAVSRMDALMDSEPVKTDAEAPVVRKPTAKGQISILRLGKEYLNRPKSLEEVSLQIAAGEKIGMLGRPGAGKTTLLKVLAGLVLPDEGEVLIDGYNLNAISVEDRAQWLSYKPQDPVLFAGTLESNLLLAGIPTNSKRFEQALWASGLDDELRLGRLTLNMAIAERGSNLSGGQRQKVALARAFAQPSRILLLDEPSLGFDPEGEALVAERLPQILEGATLLMTTHSAVMMQVIDRIIGLDNGRVTADGPKEKLLRPPA